MNQPNHDPMPKLSPDELKEMTNIQSNRDDKIIQNMFDEIQRLTIENAQLIALNEAKTIELRKHCQFMPSYLNSSATKCGNCGREKYLHK